MNRKLVAITDLDHADIKRQQEVLWKHNIDPVWLNCRTEDDLIDQCKGFKALINQYAPFTEKVFAALPDLRMIVRFGVGVDNIDLKSATRHNVKICNVPDYGTQEVADHAIGLLLCLSRKIIHNFEDIKSGIWEYHRVSPIYRHSEQTVGIIGVGRIGTAFAFRAKAFGFNIIVNDEAKRKANKLQDFMIHVELDELLKQADIVSIHIPLDGNHNLIDYEKLHLMKKNAFLVNVSRGGIVNEDDLYRALSEGLIAGGACDVFKNEPLDKHNPLLQSKNFIATSHIAWYSEQSCVDLEVKVAEEAVRGALDQELLNVVNRDTKGPG
ncbi:MAG: C-terminal binding protein [Anaerolineales bacterium]|nr:MAG: C-terminal binding protein [Anaerolineales bacterium]